MHLMQRESMMYRLKDKREREREREREKEKFSFYVLSVMGEYGQILVCFGIIIYRLTGN